MAGYILYSLDWQKFSALIERPTQSQLKALAEVVAENRDDFEGEFEADDPIRNWPADVPSLPPIVAQGRKRGHSTFYLAFSRIALVA